MKLWQVVLASFGLAWAAVPASAAPVDLRRLFPASAPVELPDPGASLFQLELPAAVLAKCRADLSDLRILDERGVQVPFVIDRAAPRPLPTVKLTRVAAEVLAADRHEVGRGDAPNRIEETYELRAPPAPPAGSRWELVLETALPEFVRQLRITSSRGSSPRGSSANAPSASGVGAESVTGSVFRLRSGQAERLRTELPDALGQRLVVHLSGEGRAAVEPRFVYEARERLPAVPSARIPLEVLPSSDTDEGRFELARPGAIVPSALGIETLTPAFERRVEVRDAGQGGQQRGNAPALLGAGVIFRVPGEAPAASIESLEVPLAAAAGQSLEVHIDNGDSPGLESPSFSAVIDTPSLLFALPAGQRARLYFGGGRAHAPRYDLSLLLRRRAPSMAPSAVARLGEIGDNPAFDRTPALAFAMQAGSVVDERLYTHQRNLELSPSNDGLSRVRLAADDLAWLRPDYGDLRVVDAEGRQWPYLIEPAQRADVVKLSLGERKRTGKSSEQALQMPLASVAANALELEVVESYFDRTYRLSGESLEGKPLELARGRLTRSAVNAPEPVRIELSGTRVRGYTLTVDDGDNAPLTFRSARAHVAVPDVYIPAQPGRYRLLLGHPSDSPPSYDIERARELVLAVSSHDNAAEPLSPNPAYRSSARLATSEGASHIAFWIALTLAVMVLGGLTLRLARQSDEKS